MSPPQEWPKHSGLGLPKIALRPEQLALDEEMLGLEGSQDDASGAPLYKNTFVVPAKRKRRRRRLSDSRKLIESRSIPTATR